MPSSYDDIGDGMRTTNILLVLILLTQVFIAFAIHSYFPYITYISGEAHSSRLWLETIGEKQVKP